MDKPLNEAQKISPENHARGETFDEIYRKEWEEIKKRRETQLYQDTALPLHEDTTLPDLSDNTRPENLVGLALSGGGIRSATFCLGLLQGLHKLKLLRIFDYLSTVSGGGYVGGWWSAWLAREQLSSEMGEEFALLCPDDIKDAASLAIKLRSSEDPVTIKLRRRFAPETLALLANYRDRTGPSAKLVDALVNELNLAISEKHFSTHHPADNGEPQGRVKMNGEQAPAEDEPKFEPNSLWANRRLLETAYPLEIEACPLEFKDIFPPREQIEPERLDLFEQTVPAEPLIVEGREAESSKSAGKDPIHHLRLYANYLTPRRGLLSADTWRAVSIITRNLALTWFILLPVLTALILIGQLYFLLHPQTKESFLGETRPAASVVAKQAQASFLSQAVVSTGANEFFHRSLLPLRPEPVPLMVEKERIFRERLIAIGQIVGAFAGLIALMAIIWLLLNRDDPSITYWIIQFVCFGVVGSLILTGINIIKPLAELKEILWPARIPFVLWLLVALCLLLNVFLRQPKMSNGSPADREVKIRWRREAWRSHISRTHTQLMVMAFVVLVVLLLAGFGHEIISGLRDYRGYGNYGSYVLGLLPVLSAVAGAIFTAMRATPSGGGERLPNREPSAISRFIFAVTPGLVVMVLAVIISWLGHWLIAHLWQEPGVGLMQAVAVFYGISLCLTLAVYEMKWRILRWSRSLLAFVCLLTANISWSVSALLAFPKWVWWGALVLAVAALIALARVFINNRQRKRLSAFSIPSVAFAIVLPWLIASPTVANYLLFELAAFAGVFLLFRVLLVRNKERPDFFEMKFLRSNASSRSSEAIWLLAVCCLLLPIVVGSWWHYVKVGQWGGENLAFLFLPLAIAALLLGLILFRIVANKVRLEQENSVANPSPAPSRLEQWLVKICATDQKLHPLKLLAIGIVGLVVIAGSASKSIAQQSSLLRLNFPSLIFGLVATVILFTVSGPQTATPEVLPYPFKWFARRLEPQCRRRFLWVLAGMCLVLGLLVGFLADVELNHVQLYSSVTDTPLTRMVLSGMIACFTIALFEMRWGKVENRRSLWLLTIAYATLLVLFIISTHPDWNVKQLLTVLGLLAAILVWIVALGWMVDPNSVSMHQFYKSRLVRAYLGASNLKRRKQRKEITESTIDDDLLLSSMKNCGRGAPYHIINTTLNLVAGRDLSTAQRSASSFILSQLYCGSSRTLYRPTNAYMEGQLSLGTAVAASGAAVSPSMGAKKPTAAQAMLLTLLNVRLGFWAPTPNRDHWKLSQPRLWPFYLLREFLSQTNDLSSYCYLTDGGHFDNTGLYSLIERGCRFIVLVDCGADPEPCFQDLGDAIRRCRIDFGTEIALDIEPFIKTAGRPSPCCVAGKIRYSRKHAERLHWQLDAHPYSREDKDKRSGVIIYFKPSLVKNTTADVRQYGIENDLFPQQSTAHQWFDEAQFESYRRLGQLYAKEAFEQLEAVIRMTKKKKILLKDVEDIFRDAKRKFDPLDNQWATAESRIEA